VNYTNIKCSYAEIADWPQMVNFQFSQHFRPFPNPSSKRFNSHKFNEECSDVRNSTLAPDVNTTNIAGDFTKKYLRILASDLSIIISEY
jgi:hypothetical protein